jgi:hypothetical protein
MWLVVTKKSKTPVSTYSRGAERAMDIGEFIEARGNSLLPKRGLFYI